MMSRRVTHHGFTLIELLVVLIILSVIISMAVVWARPVSEARRLQATAQQCQRVLQAAEQRATLTSAVLGLQITAGGLQFYRYVVQRDRLRWVRLADDRLSQPRLFAEQKLQVHWNPHQPARLVISPSGEVTPFTLTLANQRHTFGYRLSVNAAGAMALQQVTWGKP